MNEWKADADDEKVKRKMLPTESHGDDHNSHKNELEQRTLTIGGRITVQLVSSLTRLELTNNWNIILFVFSEAV